MATNPDFVDLLSALSDEGAEYLLVGAHAVMLYTEPRYTKDLDLWVRPTGENAERVLRALRRFQAPLFDLTAEDLATPGTVFQIGIAPNRIDILTDIDGVSFDEAWSRRRPTTYGKVQLAALSMEDLLRNKRASGRPQDLLDVSRLEQAREVLSSAPDVDALDPGSDAGQ
jgi:hypothetical protein